MGLAYPCGATPGFDPTHPAAGGCVPMRGLSAVASGASFIDVLTGRKATLVSTAPTAFMHGIMGPSVNITSSLTELTFTGNSTAAPPGLTLAAIFSLNSLSGSYQSILEDAPSSGPNLLALTNTRSLEFYISGLPISFNYTAVADTPYFFAASAVTSKFVNGVIVNLASGQMKLVGGACNPSVNTSNGTYRIGNNSGQPTLGKVACAMINYRGMSLSELSQWSADPWSFWYPQAN